jgi:hypothetical protein
VSSAEDLSRFEIVDCRFILFAITSINSNCDRDARCEVLPLVLLPLLCTEAANFGED